LALKVGVLVVEIEVSKGVLEVEEVLYRQGSVDHQRLLSDSLLLQVTVVGIQSRNEFHYIFV
jgi:hypothetical protein